MEGSVAVQKSRRKPINPKIGNSNAMRHWVGSAHVQLALDLLGGERVPEKKREEGDIHHWRFDTKIEVKASGTDNRILAFDEQMDRYLRARGFPLAHCWYQVFQYENTKLRPLHKSVDRVSDLIRELQVRMRRMAIFDIDVLDVMRRSRHTGFMRDGQLSSTVLLRNSTLGQLEANPKGELVNLGITNIEPQQMHVAVESQGHVFSFPVLVVLPPEQLERVMRRLRRFTIRPTRSLIA